MPAERSKGADITQQILAHATRLFAARGFVGASLRDIAKAVGIRKPSLLYHFNSKDDLRRGVLENMLGHWNEVVPRLLKAATSGHEQFEAVATETIEFFRTDPDRARLLLRELLDRPEEMEPLIETHVQPWTKIICDYIRKGQQQGRVHPDIDPEAYVVHMITLMVCGVALQDSIIALMPASPSTDRGELTTRYVVELLRVARAGLFMRTEPPATAIEQATAELPPKGGEDREASE
ncbi:TetR/AcrR family transcriptional regulator [Paraliomyxa miuraensis]|uniref:TetR/AcrR family transcriptional regulator n=1 Tax=Paraliomyxa miuraensis TaxID=376150 RepID=UPI002254D9F6|nr:TetR/AcrR family transcriptional regulator [Paraliomyxa miuraensis]MCX4246943.1 TetR/AcrR family transcriptional regulator [Paraliomyxa miuraensis]